MPWRLALITCMGILVFDAKAMYLSSFRMLFFHILSAAIYEALLGNMPNVYK